MGRTGPKEVWTVIETPPASVDRFVVDISKVGKHVYISLNDAREDTILKRADTQSVFAE